MNLTKPNVLLILADAHARDTVGCFGNYAVHTPAIDGLACDGVRFSAAYCQNPVCIPSRSSLLTGRIPSSIGMYENNSVLSRKHTLLSDVFSDSGYKTAWFGKLHCGYDGARFDIADNLRKDEAQLTEAEYRRRRLPQNASVGNTLYDRDGAVVEKCEGFLDLHKTGPFFLVASFDGTHFPYEVGEEYFDRYDGVIKSPLVPEEMLNELPGVLKNEFALWLLSTMTPEQTAKARAIYYGMVTRLDYRVGRVLRALRDLHLVDNTIVVYTADHGEMAGDHGLWYKNSFYESAAGVPMIWSIPGEKHLGWTDHRPAMNIDIMPTLCKLCGLKMPDTCDGMVLDSLLSGRPSESDRFAFIESFRGYVGSRAVRYRNWKYCYYEDQEQLFNLRLDPGEMTNLVMCSDVQDVRQMLTEAISSGWSNRRRGKLVLPRKHDPSLHWGSSHRNE